jgi:hypothetical protein
VRDGTPDHACADDEDLHQMILSELAGVAALSRLSRRTVRRRAPGSEAQTQPHGDV